MAGRPRLARAVAVVLAAAALAALALALAHRARTLRPRERPNVLLVTIDTLRADALGCYGNAAAGTPALDALAARGVRFETVVAPAPLTSPSHASILSGLTPLRHGVRDNGGYVLPEGVPSLPEAFRSAGYRTAGFVSGFPLARRFGFARGFETFDDRLPRGNDPRRAPYVERTADRTTDAVLRWLASADASPPPGAEARPFFLWVHYYDPHAPYEPPAPFAARFAARPYQGEVAFVDAQLGRLLARLAETGLRARTVVLVTADHGEALGEHGEQTHGIFVYDTTVLIPWIMAGPGVPSGLVSRATSRAIDVAPTLLDLARLPPLRAVEGLPRRPLPGREPADEPAYVESLSPLLHLGWAPLHAWRTRRYKLVDAPTPELYDLEADPTEARNIAAANPERVADLRRPLAAALAAHPPRQAEAVDSETAERLSALGYLAQGPGPSSAGGDGRRDAKDHVALLARLERGMSLFRRDPAAAIVDLTAVLDEDPGVVIARRYRAIASAGSRRPEAALADLRALEQAGALTSDDLVTRADCLVMLGRSGEAIESLAQAERLQPSSPRPSLARARVFAKEGRDEEARAALERVLALDPDQTEALRDLGDLAAFHGDLASAAQRYERARALDPEDAGVATKLGVVRLRQQLPAQAISLFEQALAAGAPSTAALNGLAQARLANGDAAGARAAFQESLRLAPGQPEVVRALGSLTDRRR